MTMRYLVTCNGPTGLLLASEWVDDEDAADEMATKMALDWPGLVCIGYRSEQQIEDGE